MSQQQQHRQLLEEARRLQAFEGDDEARRAAFPAFAAKNPLLFRAICRGRCQDLGHLEFMLDRLDDVSRGAVSEEDASRAVADRLNAEYIDPVLRAAPPPEAPDAVESRKRGREASETDGSEPEPEPEPETEGWRLCGTATTPQ